MAEPDKFRIACEGGHIDEIKQVIQEHPKAVNWQYSFGWTCESGNVDTVEWMYYTGLGKWNGYADLNDGLGVACRNRHLNLAKWLIKMGATECNNCFCISLH